MSNEGIAGRITRPENCVLGFGIPTTQEDFLKSHDHGPAGNFAEAFSKRNGDADERTYQREVIGPCQRLGAEIQRLGARVVHNLTFSDYARLFHEPEPHAVIILSHWGGDFIEFLDGLASIGAIITAVPTSFAGIIDLCVCHPKELIPLLRASRPQCLIRHTSVDTTPVVWLYFYRDLFHSLRTKPMSYLDASIELAAAYYGNPQEEVYHEKHPATNG